MSLDDIAIFLILVLLWIGAQFLLSLRLYNMWGSGRWSFERALVIHSASVAVLPLLAVPWAGSMGGVITLLGAAGVLFVFEILLAQLFRRFLARNS